jgi:hypothetical protein
MDIKNASANFRLTVMTILWHGHDTSLSMGYEFFSPQVQVSTTGRSSLSADILSLFPIWETWEFKGLCLCVSASMYRKSNGRPNVGEAVGVVVRMTGNATLFAECLGYRGIPSRALLDSQDSLRRAGSSCNISFSMLECR